MVVLNRANMYAIADALGIAIEYDSKTGRVDGGGQRQVMFDDVPAMFPITVVSSFLTGKVDMVLAKIAGNLGLLITAKSNGKPLDPVLVDLHLLNLAKMGKPDGWLESYRPSTVNDALRLLDKAVVRSFIKTGQDKWEYAI